MRIDWSGVEVFLAYVAGEVQARELLRHPAYETVRRHCRLAYGVVLSADDLQRAVAGADSPLFGLENLDRNLPRIRDFVAQGRRLGAGWLADAAGALSVFATPAELEEITVYPMIGYDAGIGLGGCACMNVNFPAYLRDPREFGYMVIHECSHVIYGRTRPMPDISADRSPRRWFELFSRMTHDEGYAVYAPLSLRRARGHMGDRSHPVLSDYAVIGDDGLIAGCLREFRQVTAELSGPEAFTREEYMDMLFGPRRLTYRAGCEIIRRVAASGGLRGVADLFRLPGERFIAEAGHLVGLPESQTG